MASIVGFLGNSAVVGFLNELVGGPAGLDGVELGLDDAEVAEEPPGPRSEVGEKPPGPRSEGVDVGVG